MALKKYERICPQCRGILDIRRPDVIKERLYGQRSRYFEKSCYDYYNEQKVKKVIKNLKL